MSPVHISVVAIFVQEKKNQPQKNESCSRDNCKVMTVVIMITMFTL